jgi:hypothetical protein
MGKSPKVAADNTAVATPNPMADKLSRAFQEQYKKYGDETDITHTIFPPNLADTTGSLETAARDARKYPDEAGNLAAQHALLLRYLRDKEPKRTIK